MNMAGSYWKGIMSKTNLDSTIAWKYFWSNYLLNTLNAKNSAGNWNVFPWTTRTSISPTIGKLCINALRWRHTGRDSVSHHQPHGCLLNRLFRHTSKKSSKLRVTGLCAGNSPGLVNSPHKGPVTRKMFPFDDVIMVFEVQRPSTVMILTLLFPGYMLSISKGLNIKNIDVQSIIHWKVGLRTRLIAHLVDWSTVIATATIKYI